MEGAAATRSRRRTPVVALLLVVVIATVAIVLATRSGHRFETGWQRAPAGRHATTPLPQTSVARTDAAIERLRRVVREHASDPTNSWALIHSILAEGPEFETSDGQNAIDYLYAEVAQPLVMGDEDLHLPSFSKDRFCQPHVDLMLKGVLETGVSLDRRIVGKWGKGTVADHVLAAQLVFDFDPERGPLSIEHPDDLPWTLQGLATVMSPAAATWRNHAGHLIDLNEVTDWGARRLTAEDAPLAKARASGRLPVRDGKAIFAYTCGGSHLYQGLAYAVGRGFGSPDSLQAVQDATDLLFWRLRAEVQVYDAVSQNLPPDVSELDLAIQRFKFLGHWNESTHKSLILGLVQPTREQQGDLALGLALLVASVEKLDGLGAFDQIQTLRARGDPRALDNYFNLIGDSCHALRGLLLATGRGTLDF